MTGLLLLSMLIFNSCIRAGFDYPFYDYQSVMLKFQDALGNDLLEGIGSLAEIRGETDDLFPFKDLYTYEVLFPQPCMDPYAYLKEPLPSHVASYTEVYHIIGLGRDMDVFDHIGDNKWALFFSPSSNKNDCSRADRITIMLKSTYIFGDDADHEISLFYNERELTKVTFDGRDCSFRGILHNSNNNKATNNIITIILDGK